MLFLTHLNRKLKAVAPVSDISIGDWNDRNTWEVTYDKSATPADKSAAQAVIDGFDLSLAQEQDDAQIALFESDANLPRRVEDIFELAISKGLFTRQEAEEASPGINAKILERKAHRDKLQQ